MCGRFGSTFSGEELSERFDLDAKPAHLDPSYNIAPSFTIPAITRNSPNKLIMMKWGFLPEWADPTKIKLHPINARADQVMVSGFYKKAFATTRCIIPFSWFYEWHKFKADGKEQKQPYLIKVKGEKVMGFAGLYSERKDAEGRPVYTCCIITTSPNTLMKKIHNRMPVILEKIDEDLWLTANSDLTELKKLLKPFDADKMEAWRISTAINSPRNDYPDLIKPVS